MATIVTRTTGASAKGSELSFTELDNNFINLNSDKYEANDSPTFATIECDNLTAANTVTAIDFNSTSDYRLKENVVEIDDNVSELIDYLNVVEFNFKDNPTKKHVGFIAHELQSVLPGVVTGEKDGTAMQTINMTKIVPYLVKALQEANAKIQELEVKISELK